MPFATTWVDLKIIILSEVNQKEKDKHHIICVWNLIYDTSEHIQERETDSQTQRMGLWLPMRGGVGRIGSLGLADANQYIQDE